MKVKFEKKLEDNNGKKSEKESTVTFEDFPDVKKAVKNAGAFFYKKVKEVAVFANDIANVATFNVAAATANVLDSVVDIADQAINSIDRFLVYNFEIVEDEVDEDIEEDDFYEDESEQESDLEKSIEEKIEEVPYNPNYSLREILDCLEIYGCSEKVVNPVKEACIFFAKIKYPVSIYSRKAFENAVTLEKITYENIVDSIKDYFPNDSEEQILNQLKDEFEEWVVSLDIKKYCPHATFRHLIIYFVSKVRGCN